MRLARPLRGPVALLHRGFARCNSTLPGRIEVGTAVLDYEVDAYGGEDCPYDGTYTGTQRTDAQADARGDARYEITVREWDLETTCTVDEDEMSCDVGMEWSRLN